MRSYGSNKLNIASSTSQHYGSYPIRRGSNFCRPQKDTYLMHNCWVNRDGFPSEKKSILRGKASNSPPPFVQYN